MVKILGKPMIDHVYKRVIECPLVTEIAVATCDQVIYDYICSIGGNAVMTSTSHERASDRCAEALIKIEEQKNCLFDIVVIIQGDEPMVHPDMIREALEPMIADPTVLVVNLLGEIRDDKEFEDRNCIKVVCDLQGNALYFSREPIPTRHRQAGSARSKQICIIPFRRDFLLEYTRLAPTPLEVAESVDMMRILEHGLKVRMVATKHQTQSVDTPEDLKLVEGFLKN